MVKLQLMPHLPKKMVIGYILTKLKSEIKKEMLFLILLSEKIGNMLKLLPP